MARMEFLRSNQYGTTTSVVAPSGSDVVSSLYDRTTTKGWGSVNQTGTSIVLSIEFDQPTIISHVIFQNFNLEQYRLFFDSLTGNTFPTDVNVDSNTASDRYHVVGSTTVSSLQVQMDTPFTSTAEYSIGELILTERTVVFERNPSARQFKPKDTKKRIPHSMPDGGIKIFNVARKYQAEMKLNFITDSFTADLKTVYDDSDEFIFIPFPTTTAWDGTAPEVNWINEFDFTFATNDKAQGLSGIIKFKETPSG